MSEFKLKSGAVVLVDESDMHLLKAHTWRVNLRGYAVRTSSGGGKEYICLHRVIMGAEKGQTVDHINGNRLDNQRENLRFATQKENVRNSRKMRGNTSSQFKGVDFRKCNGRWRASIWVDGKKHQKFLGHFDNEHEAAHAYNKAAVANYGEFAVLNPVGFGKDKNV